MVKRKMDAFQRKCYCFFSLLYEEREKMERTIIFKYKNFPFMFLLLYNKLIINNFKLDFFLYISFSE